MSRELVDIFNQLPERNRLIRAMILQLDRNYAVVTYARRARQAGSSKFNPLALFSLAFDGITSFSYAPLRIATLLGLVFSACSFTGIIFVIYEKCISNRVPGWASLLTTFLFFSGLQLLFLGVFGEYLGKIYTEIKGRPLFVVRKKYRHGFSLDPLSDKEKSFPPNFSSFSNPIDPTSNEASSAINLIKNLGNHS
jgi:dolichol-phosphate mannosyltransferase